MPNTFSMAPRYVRDFVARTSFHSPERDAFTLLDDKLRRLYRQPMPAARGIALLGDARDAGIRFREALRARGLPERARLVVTSPPYLRVVKYGYYNWLRLWLLGYDAAAIDDLLDDAHHRDAYLAFMREVLRGLRPALADDAVIALVIGDVELDRGRPANGGRGPGRVGLGARRRAGGLPARRDRPGRRGRRPQDDEALGRRGGPGHQARPHPGSVHERGRTPARAQRRQSPDRLGLAPALAAGPSDRRTSPSRHSPAPGQYNRAMKLMYEPSDLAAMDPLVLMKNLDHVRMTSRRLSYVLQQQVHLYTPKANELRDQIDHYVEAERQIEAEMARRQLRA